MYAKLLQDVMSASWEDVVTTFKLVTILQAWNDLDSINPNMEDYYK
jgi:hypothetical protein